MADITRRLAGLLALTSPLIASSCSKKEVVASVGTSNTKAGPQNEIHDMSSMPKEWTQQNEIAMLIYPKMTALDMVGPQYMFTSLMGAKVHLVAKTKDPITTDSGIIITPTASFDECPKDLTVLFAPGGTEGTLNAMKDDKTREFMADRGSRAQYVTSVCTGALILGVSGLLEGYKATTHWAAMDSLKEFGATATDARVVKDRNRITGAGVTAGLDFGLQMLAELRDNTYAQGVQLIAEYDPHPPFNSGSIHTAPLHVKAMMQTMFAPFPGMVSDAVKEIHAKAK